MMDDATRYTQDELPEPTKPSAANPSASRSSDIEALRKPDSAEESRFANIGWRLMGGVATPNGYLRLVHANRMDTIDDEAMYETDFELRVDGVTAGYLDIEVKTRWNNGSWPWPWINIAKHPMSHWQKGAFNGRLTNKLLDFQKLPDTSFWVGVRTDFACVVVLKAADLFNFGEDYMQKTMYSENALPIIRVRKDVGVEVSDAQHLVDVIASCFGGR